MCFVFLSYLSMNQIKFDGSINAVIKVAILVNLRPSIEVKILNGDFLQTLAKEKESIAYGLVTITYASLPLNDLRAPLASLLVFRFL